MSRTLPPPGPLARLRLSLQRRTIPRFPATEGLSRREAAAFRKHGFVIKTGVLPTAELNRIVDLAWSHCPRAFDRARPESWTGMVSDCCCEETLEERQGRVKFRQRVRKESWLRDLIDGNPCIRSTAEALLGPERTPPLPYVRGLYPIFPCAINPLKRPIPHIDGHHFLLGVIVYLEEVAPGGGGIHVWPGSHLPMSRRHDRAAGAGEGRNFETEMLALAKRQAAYEITGPAGTVIFWHHRLAHAAGFNRAKKVRQALLADYPTTDLPTLEQIPPPADPWQHWGMQLRS